MKKLLALLMAVMMVLSFTGCSKENKEDEVKMVEYTYDIFTLTLPEGLKEDFSNASFKYIIDGTDMSIFCSSVKKSELEAAGYAEMTLSDFTEHVINGDAVGDRNKYEGFETFSYTAEGTDRTYFYLIASYEGSESFALINFVCDNKDVDTKKPIFLDYASKVVVR